MLKKLVIGFGVVVLLVVAVGALLPREWDVEASVVVDAPPERIWPRISDLKRWQDWVHLDPKDPGTNNVIGSPSSGVGATWTWSGAGGRGELEFTRVLENEGVWFDEKIEVNDVNANGSVTLARGEGGTRVTWKDHGTLPPVIGGLMRGMVQTTLQQHFGKALERLKAQVEAAPRVHAATPVEDAGTMVPLDAGPEASVESAPADAGR